MLDKSIKRYSIAMIKSSLDNVKKFPLMDGFRFKMFEAGDEKSWAEIETSVEEFESCDAAAGYFEKEFGDKIDELKERCFFVENEAGEKVATATAWYGDLNGRQLQRVHWVAVKSEYQGYGICKALISRVLSRFIELGYKSDVYLYSQTWSYKAINIYYKFGFRPYDDGKRGTFVRASGEYECDFEKAWEIIDEKISNYLTKV